MPMRRSRVAVFMLVAAVAVSAGCAREAARRGPEVVTRDSAGITIIENPSPDDSALNVWWRIEGPRIDIGGVDAVEPYVMHQVSGAARTPDGGIVVMNNGTFEIRTYDASGQHVRSAGREGGGPGEFRIITGFVRTEADSILVSDFTSRRLSVFSPEGQFIREMTMSSGTAFPTFIGLAGGGGLIATQSIASPSLGSSDAVQRVPVSVFRMSDEMVPLDTIGTFNGAERLLRVTTHNGQLRSIQIRTPPFGKTPAFQARGGEVYVATQDEPEISVYDESGALRRIIRTGRAPESITQAHLDALLEERLAATPPERQAEVRSLGLGATPDDNRVPPYGTILLDRGGNLWVSDYDDPLDPPGRWTVYGPDGGVLARVVLPERFRPYDIGDDWILGRELDELDVEHVRLYSLIRS